ARVRSLQYRTTLPFIIGTAEIATHCLVAAAFSCRDDVQVPHYPFSGWLQVKSYSHGSAAGGKLCSKTSRGREGAGFGSREPLPHGRGSLRAGLFGQNPVRNSAAACNRPDAQQH